ncbi:MAG: 4Fe-4S binding protein [Gemmatimonadales bacterium]|jgi:putative selenate reductase
MELQPIPFPDLLRRMRREVETADAIFDLPVRKWWIPDEELDFSALHFGHRASTPVGPAAGPHTQLAQNIVLSWLAGSRIIEIKTVQVNDRLEIPRPCIHIPNVGYNVEWSQELLVEESLIEYAKAAYLIEILKATRAFGRLPADRGFDTVFDISVGYDLEGIRSEKVTGFIEGLKDPAHSFEALRAQLSGDLAEFSNIDLPAQISDTVTLSTFHGCPADQIESICRYLLQDVGLHTIVKLNPTLLGFEAVREILFDRLGYSHLKLRREAFDMDLQYDDGLEILRRLRSVAERQGSIVGAKFTNTLVVENEPEFFPTQTDPFMYVSGPPLHVISMNLMQRFREDLGFEFPVSFSAGIDVKNFPAAVACGMVPVTTCTDLLKQGGFGRLPGYLKALSREMRKMGVSSREAFVLSAGGHAAEAVGEALSTFKDTAAGRSLPDATSGPAGPPHLERDAFRRVTESSPDDMPATLREAARAAGLDGEALVLHATRVAGRLNGRDIVPSLVDNPRYHASANSKPPRQIDSVLALYDCINCDLCIQACPNDAIFSYEADPVEVNGFSIRESHQLAVLEGACNECSNCEMYCPESGAPFVEKEIVFLTRAAFDESRLDGFFRAGNRLHARLRGIEYELEVDKDGAVLAQSLGAELDLADSARARTVWTSIYHADTPNPVNPSPS